MRILFLIVALFFPALAFAEPIYLACEVCSESNESDQKKFEIKLDEDSGKITHSRGKGSAFNAEGFFAIDTISYQDISNMGNVRITYQYKIDRNSLEVTETFIVGPSDPKFLLEIPPKTIIKKGSCHIIEVKKRKI